MQKTLLAVAALALVGACADVPDSNPDTPRGVGFGDYSDYNTYSRTPDGAPASPPAATTPSSPPRNSTVVIDPSELPASPTSGPTTGPTPGGISDEQNFAAVSERVSIENDAARMAAMASEYEAARPTAVPTRTGTEGPNVVAYALSTSHPVGTEMYRRTSLFAGRKENACAGYNSADIAQRDFLANGGPEKDRLGLDPDGDGYACGWDPSVFRRIAG